MRVYRRKKKGDWYSEYRQSITGLPESSQSLIGNFFGQPNIEIKSKWNSNFILKVLPYAAAFGINPA